MIPPRENLFTVAGIAGFFFALAFMVDSGATEPESLAAREARQELKRDLAAARACPAGHAVHWLDGGRMECLREIAP